VFGEASTQTKRIDNPLDYGAIVGWSSIPIAALIITELWIYADYGDKYWPWSLLLTGSICAIAFYYFDIKLYYIQRPRSVEISDDGVKLTMRAGKRPVIIAWLDMLMVTTGTSIMGKNVGAICNDFRWYYPVDYTIAVELREAFYQQMGKYPPKNLDELCPGMERDRLKMSSGQWERKYEQFKKK
jgi:hypothetical protein